MEDFEKLGTFYLGKRVDPEEDEVIDELILYDSKDLTTHAVIIGMTGSGKTGLGIGLIEEAAMDRIPVIAIDPKGDLGNLLLTFPDLEADDFAPWIDPRQAAEQGQNRQEYAASQAAQWKKGLGDWGQTGQRIAKLRETVDLAIYTPGSTAGLPISVLQAFDAPRAAVMEDADLYRERIQATVTSLLALMNLDTDPLTSREHILLSNLLDHAWKAGRSLDVAALIAGVQQPPIQKVGVLDLESFFPGKDRFALAMKLNNLLAAPGFQAWMTGEPLDAGRLLYTPQGKPRVSVLSIAHLNDNERMFFVSMLLNSLISWMRAQPGTGSLRAVLYMDEIFGYMPPTANPPSKMLLLTLLKQARAFGVGLALSTQNPVDLDYKGLSNTGTWFIGRLQTERDKARVMEGLAGAAGGGFHRGEMEKVIAGLGKRKFLLHNVHESEPVLFSTRWAMSYLAGPMTRDQIKTLMSDYETPSVPIAPGAPALAPPRSATEVSPQATRPPVLPPSVKQFYLEAEDAAEQWHYYPMVFGAARITYSSARYHIEDEEDLLLAVEVSDGPVPLDWDEGEPLAVNLSALRKKGSGPATYAECAPPLLAAKNYSKWSTALKSWIRKNKTITLYRSPRYKVYSTAGESEGDFRIRLQTLASEDRDQAVAKLRKRYASKSETLKNRLRRAEQTLEREAQQSSKKKLDTVISFGTAILGAFLGRKRSSGFSTALNRASGISKEAGDVRRAEETVAAVRVQLEELQTAFQNEVDTLEEFDAQAEILKEIVVKPKTTDIDVQLVGLLWRPY